MSSLNPTFSIAPAVLARLLDQRLMLQPIIGVRTDGESRVVFDVQLERGGSIALRESATVEREGATRFERNAILRRFESPIESARFEGAALVLDETSFASATTTTNDGAEREPQFERTDVRWAREDFLRWLSQLINAPTQSWGRVHIDRYNDECRGILTAEPATIDRVSCEWLADTAPFAVERAALLNTAVLLADERDPTVRLQLDEARALFECGRVTAALTRFDERERADATVARLRALEQEPRAAVFVETHVFAAALKELVTRTQFATVSFSSGKSGFVRIFTTDRERSVRCGGEAPSTPVRVERWALTRLIDALRRSSTIELRFGDVIESILVRADGFESEFDFVRSRA